MTGSPFHPSSMSTISNISLAPKRQSMLWGRSDLTEKFYSGSSQSNPWVRDLLWKHNIVTEKKRLNLPANPMEDTPPHMRSTTVANLKAQKRLDRQKKERLRQERALEMRVRALQNETGGHKRPATAASYIGSARSGMLSSRSRRSATSQKELPPLDLNRVRGNMTNRSRTSQQSRASLRSVGSYQSDASLARLATVLERQNQQLRKGLEEQERNRLLLEHKLKKMEQRIERMNGSARSSSAAEKQLKAYKTIMSKLTQTLMMRQNK